ncbi:MAG: aminodeoxychorismate synthase component I [Nitrospinota bacterium]
MIDSRAVNALNSIKLRRKPLETAVAFEEPFRQFAKISRGAEGELFLDGADDLHGKGRYSVICTAPLFIVRVNNDEAVFRSSAGEIAFTASPPEVIEWLESFNAGAGSCGDGQQFDGGLVFLLSYELNRYYEDRLSLRQNGTTGDDLWCGFYPNVRLFDSVSRTARDISYGDVSTSQERHYGAPSEDLQYALSGFECGESEKDYVKKIEKVKSYIESGDIYQANISRKLVSDFHGSKLALYGDLRKANPAAFGAFVNGGDFQLLSLSPELFFSVGGSVIETKPIKGTAPRGENPEEDERIKAELIDSEKERAENIMIVDLMRNDLSKICKPFTVTAPNLLNCESFPTVHHLVSTVRGELSNGHAKISRILAACFPGGSVTGAPKLRAMEIIAEMENSPRGFYCGSLAACGLNGTITASLLIRTLTVTGSGMSGSAVYRTGGGITSGSDPVSEFKETRHKAALLDAALRKPVLADVR